MNKITLYPWKFCLQGQIKREALRRFFYTTYLKGSIQGCSVPLNFVLKGKTLPTSFLGSSAQAVAIRIQYKTDGCSNGVIQESLTRGLLQRFDGIKENQQEMVKHLAPSNSPWHKCQEEEIDPKLLSVKTRSVLPIQYVNGLSHGHSGLVLIN